VSTTSDRNDPRLTHGVDEQPVPMAEVYLVLSEEERAKGFIRPVRRSYWHVPERGGCDVITTMGLALAETYARNPHFYGATYCAGCGMHRPVGVDGEFDWVPNPGEEIAPEYRRVGS
jgi:hypothetical protein